MKGFVCAKDNTLLGQIAVVESDNGRAEKLSCPDCSLYIWVDKHTKRNIALGLLDKVRVA